MAQANADEENLSIEAAIRDTVGGTIAFALADDRTKMAAAEQHYVAATAPLAAFDFWTAANAGNWRPPNGLWLPQRRAVEFAQAYLAACQLEPDDGAPEAALVKMPTGTGKTAVIAALACASPNIRRTLVITSREALVEQMRRDLSYRFWDRLGAVYDNHDVRTGANAAERAQAKDAFGPGLRNGIWVLGGGSYAGIWNERDAGRQIIISTFNALHLVLGPKPPAHRRFHGRTERPPPAGFGMIDPDMTPGENRRAFIEYLKSFDLVIVDEGHYEPAISWAQSVRALGRPTLIFSATPYRNDYKYFNVNGNFAFNLPWDDAVAHRLVREVSIGEPLLPPPGAMAQSAAQEFAAACQPALANLPDGKLAIVHARSFEQLIELQAAFAAQGEEAVLIHDAYRNPSPAQSDEMSEAQRRLEALKFRLVRNAVASIPAGQARLWLHQYKLLEGVDDHRFVEVWLYDPLQSARQFVQQVGRVIRRPDLGDAHGQAATIRASGRSVSAASKQTIHDQAEARWKAYLEYERYIAREKEKAFIAETQLLATVKRSAPAIQYVAREFRDGHLLDETPDLDAFLLPRRATVCRMRGVPDHLPGAISDAAFDEMAAAAREAMEVEERFDIERVRAADAERDKDVRLIRYLAWKSSPLLKEHHLPEWRLGLMALARAGRYIFLLDTEALCLDTSRLGLIDPDPTELKRLFPKDGTRIVETSASGLDVGEYGLRSLTLRKHALDEGYFDLAEASQVPTMIRGYGPLDQSRVRRRLSLGRASVSDSSYANIGVADWAAWTKRIAAALADEQTVQHRYFSRFAEERKPLMPVNAVPQSILLDLWDILDPESDTFGRRDWDEARARQWLAEDSCCLVHNVGTAERPRYEFQFAGEQVKIEYMYRDTIPAAGRYRLSSAGLNEAIRGGGLAPEQMEEANDADAGPFGRALQPSLTALLNQEQSFRVIPTQEATVYAHGSFYNPRIGPDLLSILEPTTLVAAVVSEKGDTRIDAAADWDTRTLFGLMWGWVTGPIAPENEFARDMHGCDIVICDDGTRETADFYGIDDTTRRVFVVHAKASPGPASATARKLQEVGRQAQTSLAFAGSSAAGFALPNDWNNDWRVVLGDAGGAVITKPRLLKSPANMTIAQAHDRVKKALENPSYAKHIVVQTSGMLSADAATATQNSQAQAARQFLYYCASLRTSFDRAGVRLRITCNP